MSTRKTSTDFHSPIFIVALFLCFLGVGLTIEHSQSLGRTARTIVAQCTGVKDVAACYEREVPALYPKLTVAQLFDIVREIRREDPSYQFCHVLGHKMGERVVAEDPAKWLDAIPLNPPDGLCSNGFIHGVIGGRFRAEVLDGVTLEKFIPDFKRACEPRPPPVGGWQPSDLDRAICYHGMGHLFDFITNADIPKALDMCARVAPADFSRVCIEGVFMQIYQPLEPDDFQLIAQMPEKPATSTVRQFCARFPKPEYAGACLRESWPFFRAQVTDGTGVVAFCAGQPDAEQTDNCYTSATTIIGRMNLGQPARAVAACAQLPRERQADCFEVIAQAVLEENRKDVQGAIALCGRAPEGDSDACISKLVSRGRFIFGDDFLSLHRFCALVPAHLQHACTLQQ
jgi:hypothetical protein